MGEDRPRRRVEAGRRRLTPPPRDEHRDEYRRASLHGRRIGKPLSNYQAELIRTDLPRLAVDVSAAIQPATLFAKPPTDLWLEIGFGSGEHLLAAALRNPNIGFIGCEPFLNGMARALADIAAEEVENVRVHCGDASEAIERLPEASIGRVFILYPDPWPKRRQRKRRLVSDESLGQLARVMRSGAELRFATDIDDYAGWTLARLHRSPDFCWTAERAADWQNPWAHWVQTRYETKAKQQARRGCYITALRR